METSTDKIVKDMKAQATDPNEVSAASISVPGVLMDKSGNTWTIPENNESQESLYKSPFDIPKEKDFYYQFEREEDVAGMITQGFLPVTRKELNMDGYSPSNEYGVGPDSVYKVNNMVCLKIPEVLNNRRVRALEKIAHAARMATEAPKKKDDQGHETVTLYTQSREGTKEAHEASQRLRGSAMSKVQQTHAVERVKPRNAEKEQVQSQ